MQLDVKPEAEVGQFVGSLAARGVGFRAQDPDDRGDVAGNALGQPLGDGVVVAVVEHPGRNNLHQDQGRDDDQQRTAEQGPRQNPLGDPLDHPLDQQMLARRLGRCHRHAIPPQSGMRR